MGDTTPKDTNATFSGGKKTLTFRKSSSFVNPYPMAVWLKRGLGEKTLCSRERVAQTELCSHIFSEP